MTNFVSESSSTGYFHPEPESTVKKQLLFKESIFESLDAIGGHIITPIRAYRANLSPWACRLSAIPFGIAGTLAGLAGAVSILAEAIFKGFVNIFGAPFSSSCDFKVGLKQIASGVVCSIAVAVASPLIGLLYTPAVEIYTGRTLSS